MKQSFFDKLTGTTKAQPEDTGASSTGVIKSDTSNYLVSENINMKENTSSDPKLKPNDNWHSGVEGQLTVDVYQTPSEIVVKSTIAGVTIEDLDISITNDMVTVRGDRKKDEDVPSSDYFHQECYWGPFSRSIILPMDVDSESVSAAFKNGILTIRLPKAEKVKTKKIRIAG